MFYIKKTSSKITSFNLTVQDLEKASSAVPGLAHGLASSEEAGRVTDRRTGGGWETAELEGGPRRGGCVQLSRLRG